MEITGPVTWRGAIYVTRVAMDGGCWRCETRREFKAMVGWIKERYLDDHEALALHERHFTEHLEARLDCMETRRGMGGVVGIWSGDKMIAGGPTRFAAKIAAVIAIGKEKQGG